MERTIIRNADATEIDPLVWIWHEGWHDAHTHIVPAGLVRVRTIESFRNRLFAVVGDIRVAGPVGAPAGFYVIKDDELYQIFVSADARGTGVAAILLADAEARLAANGVTTAWLACTVGNDRAARFYEKHGWRRALTEPYTADTLAGPYTLDVWRYEKVLPAASSGASGGK